MSPGGGTMRQALFAVVALAAAGCLGCGTLPSAQTNDVAPYGPRPVGGAASSGYEVAPIQIALKSIQAGKPPLKFHDTVLTIRNERNTPTWYVLPDDGDEPLPTDGVFKDQWAHGRAFSGAKYRGPNGAVIKIRAFSAGGCHAFLLPPGGRIEVDGYEIKADKEIDSLDVIEAGELRVNGVFPLSEWLPFDAMCDKQAKVKNDAIVGCEHLDGDTFNPNRPNAKTLMAEGVRKWTVQFKK